MTIQKINTESPIYKVFSEKHGSVFNSPDWLKMYGESVNVMGIFNANSELIGAFNIYKATKFGLAYSIVPPYSPSNGLVFVNPASNTSNRNSFEKEVHACIIDYFNSLKSFLTISAFPVNIIDTQLYFWNKFKVIPNYTYQLETNFTEEELFANLTSEKRKSIRKAEKDGVEISACEDYKLIKELVLKTFDRKSKTVNESFLNAILFKYATNKNSFAFVAYINGKASACTFCVYDKTTAYYLFGGYDEGNKHHGAGVTCMWHSILNTKKLGLPIFDFEGSMLPEVEKYFREFGGVIKPYYTIQKAWLPIEMILKLKQRNRF